MSMLIKAKIPSGWQLFDGALTVRHSNQHTRVDIYADADPDFGQMGLDGLLPLPPSGTPGWQWDEVHTVYLSDPVESAESSSKFWACRWVAWTNDRDQQHLLVTDAPVYICNDRGDTIEALR